MFSRQPVLISKTTPLCSCVFWTWRAYVLPHHEGIAGWVQSPIYKTLEFVVLICFRRNDFHPKNESDLQKRSPLESRTILFSFYKNVLRRRKRHSPISCFNRNSFSVSSVEMYKFVLLLACVSLVQGLMPMLRINKDINRIDFGDVQPTPREHRRQQRHNKHDQGYGGYAPAHGYHDQGGYDHGQYAGQIQQQLHHGGPYPKFFAYYNAGGKRGGGLGSRRNKVMRFICCFLI